MYENLNTIKQEILEELLNHSPVLVTINLRHPGVEVPKQYSRENCASDTLTLRLSWKFPGKMALDLQGVSAELRFDGVISTVFFPWEAVSQYRAPDVATYVFLTAPADFVHWITTQGLPDPPEALHVISSFPPEELEAFLEAQQHDEPKDQPETIVDRTKELGLTSISGEGLLTPPRTGQLRLVH